MAQFILCGLIGYALATNLPGLRHEFAPLRWVSIPVFGGGAIVLLLAVRSFRVAETTVNPIEPGQAEQLVTSGLYRISRNPMYLGMLLVLVAAALVLQNLAAFGGPMLFVISITNLQIIPEERVLRQKFGSAFEAYCKQTRRWL